MLFADATYPTTPLPPIAAVVLEGFEANQRCRENDREGGADLDEVSYQRCCALHTGAWDLARAAGPKDSHADQAATLLVMIDDLDQLLDGSHSAGRRLLLDDDERRVLIGVRGAAEALLRWHFNSGAGALRPIAADLNLLHGATA